jgi:hypothetical protein
MKDGSAIYLIAGIIVGVVVTSYALFVLKHQVWCDSMA